MTIDHTEELRQQHPEYYKWYDKQDDETKAMQDKRFESLQNALATERETAKTANTSISGFKATHASEVQVLKEAHSTELKSLQSQLDGYVSKDKGVVDVYLKTVSNDKEKAYLEGLPLSQQLGYIELHTSKDSRSLPPVTPVAKEGGDSGEGKPAPLGG